jgi:hypothetical protein
MNKTYINPLSINIIDEKNDDSKNIILKTNLNINVIENIMNKIFDKKDLNYCINFTDNSWIISVPSHGKVNSIQIDLYKDINNNSIIIFLDHDDMYDVYGDFYLSLYNDIIKSFK